MCQTAGSTKGTRQISRGALRTQCDGAAPWHIDDLEAGRNIARHELDEVLGYPYHDHDYERS
jgi:hypothetical protein